MSEAENQEFETDLDSVASEDDVSDRRRYISERGAFFINANPKPNPAVTAEQIKGMGKARIEKWVVSRLAEKESDEEVVRDKLGEMLEAVAPGYSENVLVWQGGEKGMSIVHAWFGPNLPLFRHSHSRLGDCMYYVAAGEAIMGKRQLKPGSTFFIPNGMPYKYTAGPDGVEVLEFRADGDGVDQAAPHMRIDELSLDAIQKITDTALENQDGWKVPENFSDTGHVKS